MIIRKLHELEWLEWNRISALSFNWSLDTDDVTPESYAEQHRPKQPAPLRSQAFGEWGAFTDDGEMMAGLLASFFRVHFDGGVALMAGVGGVCTYPQHRRKGAVKGIFRHMLDGLHEARVPFSYLYPFSEQFYEGFGYRNAAGGIEWSFDLSMMPPRHWEGSFSLHRPGAPIDGFDAAYGPFAARWNMMVLRSPDNGHSVQHCDPFKHNKSAFLYRDAAGVPRGYVSFERHVQPGQPPALAGKELVFDTTDTLKAIMGFMKSYASDYALFTIKMPESLNLDHFCTDFAQSNTAKSMKKNGMTRAVHVEQILRSARYVGSGQLSLFIHDAFLPQNNGLYALRWQDGTVASVAFSHLPPAPMGQRCDVEMTVNAFAPAILGSYAATEFAFMDGVRVNTDLAKVAQVFYKKPCWISNFF